MSGHHRTKEWFSVARAVRPVLLALIKAGEAHCTKCGFPVYEDQKWQIDHIIAVSLGGTDDWSNLGPAHTHCNQKDGGKLGAAKTNANRAKAKPKVQYPY